MIPFWPFGTKIETRSEGYSESLESLLVEQARGSTSASPAKLAALEISLGLWGRAFASAEVTPGGPVADALSPSTLVYIGRELIRVGEAVFLIEIVNGRLMLSPCHTWDIDGGPDPDSWVYDVERAGPSRTKATRNVAASRIVHLRYSVDPSQPWRGLGPLQRARTSATLAANVETRLSEELGQSAGEILPVPDGKKKSELQADLRKIAGQVALVESTSAGWGDGSQGAPRRDLEQKRIGAHPPDVLAVLRSDAALHVLALCGVPTTLLERSDGTALRESWRQFLHSSVQPVALIASEELSEKLDTPLSLSFNRMFASDLSGRARAFQSMVGGGMDVQKAAALAGLMVNDDA